MKFNPIFCALAPLINAVEIAKIFVNYSSFYAVYVAYGQMFVMFAILSKFSKYFWCIDIQVCTCEKKRYEAGDFDKNRYKFYMKFILLIDA